MPYYRFLVEESSLDGAGLASSAADGEAVGTGVALAGAAGVGAAIGVGVGTKTVGMGEAVIGGAEGVIEGDAAGAETCNKAVPTP